jgi:class 3 adenylate cyclase
MRTSVTQPTIDELLDRAVEAINRGDRATADALAGQVLAVDRSNPDAEELLAAPEDSGEIRRLTILFADLVDSTALSTRIEPEIYRTVVGRYREQVRAVVDRYKGDIESTRGDGLLAVFGHPKAHENDVRRAVQADSTSHVRSTGSASAYRAGSGSTSASGSVFIGDWSTSTPPMARSTVSEPTSRPEYAASPGQAWSPFQRRLNDSSATCSTSKPSHRKP